MKRIFQNKILLQCLFAFFGIFYFSLYCQFLQFSFSWLSFFFTLSCIFGFLFYFHIAKHIFSIIIGEVFLLSFFVFSLVNGAVFKVFGKFLPLSFGWFTESNMTPSFFVDFVNMVPWYLYLFVVIIFCLSILLIFAKENREEKQDILFCGVPLEHARSFQMNRLFVFVGFFLLQGISFLYAKNIILSPKGEWWDSKVYFGDIGYPGHVYAEIYGIFGKDLPQLDTVYAQEEIQESVEDTGEIIKYPWYREEERGSYSHIRNVFRELGGVEEKDKIPLSGYSQKPHIIFYQLESVPSWVFLQNPTPMPYLKKLIEENYHVEHFIPNGCSTINAEFSTLCSQLSFEGKHISETADEGNFYCLPQLLLEKYGYTSQYLHASGPEFYSRESLGPKWGFEEMYFSPYFEKKESDGVVLSELIAHMKASSKPVFGQVVGYSSHAPHGDDVLLAMKEKYAKDLPPYTQDIHSGVKAGIELDEYGTQTYLWFLSFVDKQIENLFLELENEGLADETIVVIYGDHRYYNFPGKTKDNFYWYNEVPFVIVDPSRKGEKLAEYASNIDVAPTILHMLEGSGSYIPEDEFLGTSLFAKNHPNSSMLKCLGYVDYVDTKVVVQGNIERRVYNVSYENSMVTEEEKTKYLQTIPYLEKKTDDLFTHK